MVVSIKDSFKLFGISIITCCAVCVCNLFLNYSIDLKAIEPLVEGPAAEAFYSALESTSVVCCSACGGCLSITSVILLFFYVKHYIDSHSKQIGILKALGYGNFRIATGFAIFGLSVLIGCLAGYLLSFALMPIYYDLQNDNDLLPLVERNIHWILLFLLVVLPSIVFGILSVFYSVFKLNQPTVNLLKGESKTKKGWKGRGKEKKTFLAEMRSSVLHSRKTLVFLVGLSVFCFSSMLQMSASMDELASEMMSLMILIIGIVLAFTTLYIALTTVIASNQKNIAMLRVFGYSGYECKKAVLDGYRPAAYIGFVLGTVYQYALLKIMVTVVFADVVGVPDYKFDWLIASLTLIGFILIYEGTMFAYGYSMKHIPLKRIMDE